ncbi:MAG: WGR domain-containing protein [Gammaproteobacteria bacterium]|nr:WGR domain-containing protein [Gammaproteobacteria bacterium]
MHIYMQIAAAPDKAPRFYNLLLQQDLLGGWSLIREWGQQGRAGRVIREHFTEREAAETALIDARDIQLKKGFRVVFVQGEGQRRGA